MRARRLRVAAGVLCACAVLGGTQARANSIYSVGGLGEPQLEEPARIRALGGSGAAERGPRTFSLVNPASLADVEHLLVEGTVTPALRRVRSSTYGTENVEETTFPSARVAIALPGRVTLAASYVAGTNAEFRVDREESAGAASTLRIDGSGGISFLRLSLARRMAPSLRLGVDYDAIAGSYRETWFRVFSDSGLVPARDTLQVNYSKKGRWRFGTQLVKDDWCLGVVYETEQDLPLEITRSTIGVAERFTGRVLTLPSGWVVGVSAPIRERLRAVAQYRRANWKRSSLASDFVDFRALQRFSVGLERARGTDDGMSFWRRLPIRFGGYLLQWPDLLPVAGASDVTGGTAEVNEIAATLGAGLVTKDKGGGIDLSLEVGTRGDRGTLGVNERFVRLGVSLLLSDETWKGTFHR